MRQLNLRCAAFVAFAIALIVAALFVSAPARAAEFVPLQPAHTGTWIAPVLDGGGVGVHVQRNADGLTALIWVFEPGGQWYFGQSVPHGTAVVAVLELPPLRGLDMGTLALESRGCAELRLSIVGPSLIGTLQLEPLGPLLGAAGCYRCVVPDEPDFSPSPPVPEGCAPEQRKLVAP